MPLSYKPITKKEKIFYPNFILIFCKLFHYIRGTGPDFFLNVNLKKWIDCNYICAKELKFLWIYKVKKYSVECKHVKMVKSKQG